MINEWDKQLPGRSWNVFGALTRVVPSHLMDTSLFDFASLQITGKADPGGDIAFDSTYYPDLTPLLADDAFSDAPAVVRRPGSSA